MKALGAKVRDAATGYTGTITGVAMYLGEDDLNCRVTRADQNGKPEDVWLAEGRLEHADTDRPVLLDRPLGFPRE